MLFLKKHISIISEHATLLPRGKIDARRYAGLLQRSFSGGRQYDKYRSDAVFVEYVNSADTHKKGCVEYIYLKMFQEISNFSLGPCLPPLNRLTPSSAHSYMMSPRCSPPSAGEASGSRERKTGLSCAECRRSKLKCDRVFPCQSCVRRGCAAICPDGTLAATKGNKVLMAHAQRLTEQVKAQNVRIKELEDALRRSTLQSPSDEPSPNLSVSDISDTSGSLVIHDDSQAVYVGESAGSEYYRALLERPDIGLGKAREPSQLGLPKEINDLARVFPFGSKDMLYTKHLFVPFIPDRDRALQLAELYYRNMAWMFDPIPRGDFMKIVIGPLYGNALVGNVDAIHTHHLGLFFIIMASGSLHENYISSADLANQYYVLCRAAVSLEPILEGATCATVQVLFAIWRYMFHSDPSTNEFRWMLGGLCCRIAHTIGLQRDSAPWGVDADEVQRRRTLFWELYTHEAWTCFISGRPPSLALHQSDTRYPDDLDQVVKPSGELDMSWHAHKFRYSAICLSHSLQHVFSAKPPSYESLLELDRKIRQFPIPSHLQSPMRASEVGRSWSAESTTALQQYSLVTERESNLLYIHRSSFAQALREAPDDPLEHPYAPSVLAAYRSAVRLVSSLQSVYAVHPDVTSTVWFFWSGVFFSCILLGAIVVESPGCKLVPNAIQEFDQALAFYEEGSRPCRFPSSLKMLQKLNDRAHAVYEAYCSNPGAPRIGITRRTGFAEPDELEVLAGRKAFIGSGSSSSQSSHSHGLSSHGGSPSPQPFMQSGAEFMPQASQAQRSSYLLRGELPDDQLHTNALELVNFERLASLPMVTSSGAYATSVFQHQHQGFSSASDSSTTYQRSSDEYLFMQLPYQPSTSPYGENAYMQPQVDPSQISSGQQMNQEEIWQNFLAHLGLNNP